METWEALEFLSNYLGAVFRKMKKSFEASKDFFTEQKKDRNFIWTR